MKLRFVTGNPGKLREALEVLSPLGIEAKGHRAPIVEIQADRLAEVASFKARNLLGRVPPPYFLEDAGLFVKALGGFPGPYSSYAFRTIGCEGILHLVAHHGARAARFEATIAYIDAGTRLRLFRGQTLGRIATAARGTRGFGFDPIFQPQGHRRTYAELEPEEKNRVSHRGKALRAFARHLLRVRPNKKG